jgi:Uma2 family endonuclease
MSTQTEPRPIVYPDSDGQPMSDNTLQFEYIATIKGGLDSLFRDVPDVFVAGDLLWYPVEGQPGIRTAPDAMVAFGRPKGYRGSYRQWEEGGIPPQVVFEVLSPGNRGAEMRRKLRFYDRHGVEEYYQYDPHRGELAGWTRGSGGLHEIPDMAGWVSPRLGVRFDLDGTDLRLCGPDGRRFLTYAELAADRARAEERAGHAGTRAARESARADRESERAERLAERLRRLGVDPED